MRFKKTKTSALSVAREFLLLAKGDGAEITHEKLQRLLYYAQALNLYEHKAMLFKEPIEAWPEKWAGHDDVILAGATT